jgi:hypothetical protein
MTGITQIEVIDVGEGVGAQSSAPVVPAGPEAKAGMEGGDGAEWQMVTRGKAEAGRVRKTIMRIRPIVVDEGEGSQQPTPGFEAASTVARKRKAEDSVNDKLTAVAATITQLVMAQEHTAKSLEAF